ncbi:MAG: response regulator [Chloroflexota bacterium]|nr:response regulator [Chloroflexota bacterium]
MIRILLVDDHASFRQPLAFMLGREPDLEVIGQAGSLAEARQLLDDADLALIDLDLPDGDGVDFIVDLAATNPHTTALVLTGSACPNHHARAMAAGAAEVLPKSVTIDDVIHAVRRLRPDGRG